MQLKVKAVHFDLNQQQREHIDKRLERFTYGRDYLHDLALTLTRESNLFHADASLHFRWGNTTHLRVSGYDVLEAFDKLFDKTQAKISKEKDKITQRDQSTHHQSTQRDQSTPVTPQDPEQD